MENNVFYLGIFIFKVQILNVICIINKGLDNIKFEQRSYCKLGCIWNF